MDSAEASQPLWDFACEAWEDAGIRASCLNLQNAHGLNPNELLFAVWCAKAQRLLNHSALADCASRGWHVEVTQRIRQARQSAVRLEIAPAPVTDQLREVELAVEQVELGLLQESLASLSSPAEASKAEILLDNLTGFHAMPSQRDPGGGVACVSLLNQLAAQCMERLPQ